MKINFKIVSLYITFSIFMSKFWIQIKVSHVQCYPATHSINNFREDEFNYISEELLRYLSSVRTSQQPSSAPPIKKRSICISDFMQTTFLYLGKFLKKLADDQCSSITKGSIYRINHITTVVDWPEIRCLMEVSTMFHICRYCVFTWDGRAALPIIFYRNSTQPTLLHTVLS